MFTHQLAKDNALFTVAFSDYAKLHYLKRFEKDYKGRQWEVTVESIVQDMSRMKTSDSDLQKTQQTDELWQKTISGFSSTISGLLRQKNLQSPQVTGASHFWITKQTESKF